VHPTLERSVSTVERLIPADWRDEIVVLDAGVLERARGSRPRGSQYVTVGVVDWVAWRQARSSLAPHVDNSMDDWLEGGEARDEFQHVITLWNPTLDLKPWALAGPR
jgi:hypothetical protein